MISVIIPCYNGEKHIDHCLTSLLSLEFKDYEIIVIDDGSDDNSQEILREYENNQKVRLILNNESLGPAIRRNQAVKQAQGEILFFLDIDTRIEPNALANLNKAFKNNKKMGGGQAKLILGNTNKLDSAGHYLSPIGFPYEIGAGESIDKFNQKLKILGGKTAGFAVRKDVFNQINGFDEDYFIYGEDTDLSWRIWLVGSEVYYLPKVKVRHFQKSSLNKETNYRVFYEGAKNNITNLFKNLSFRRLIWMLPIHFLSWILLSFKLIFQGKFKLALWIYRGLGWDLSHLGKLVSKRKQVRSYTINKYLDKNILFGTLNWGKLLSKGINWVIKS